jgi:hypothetical protein
MIVNGATPTRNTGKKADGILVDTPSGELPVRRVRKKANKSSKKPVLSKTSDNALDTQAMASFFSAFEPTRDDPPKQTGKLTTEGKSAEHSIGGHLFLAAVHLVEAGRLALIALWRWGKGGLA